MMWSSLNIPVPSDWPQNKYSTSNTHGKHTWQSIKITLMSLMLVSVFLSLRSVVDHQDQRLLISLQLVFGWPGGLLLLTRWGVGRTGEGAHGTESHAVWVACQGRAALEGVEVVVGLIAWTTLHKCHETPVKLKMRHTSLNTYSSVSPTMPFQCYISLSTFHIHISITPAGSGGVAVKEPGN